MKKLLYILIPAMLPYLCIGMIFLVMYTDVGELLSGLGLIIPVFLIIMIAVLFFCGSAATLIISILMFKRGVPSQSAAGLALILKLVHIPVHLLCFFLGCLLFIWMGMGLFFFSINLFAIAVSSVISAYAMVKARLEDKISTTSAIIRVIFSSVFVIDVFLAIYNYITIRKINKKTASA